MTNRRNLILYAAGMIGATLTLRASSTYSQFLYIDYLGVRAAWVGLAWLIYGFWNAANDVIAGYLSDRTRSRWGRRIPWIATFFIPMSVVFYLLWFPFETTPGRYSEIALLAYFFVVIMLFDLLWTLVVTNYLAIFPSMVPESGRRAIVTGMRQVFSIIGLMFGIALPPIIAGEDWSNRGQMALLLAVVSAAAFAISLLGIREDKIHQQQPILRFGEALRTTIANRDFRYLLGTNVIIQYAFLALSATIPFYAKYVLGVSSPLTIGGITLQATAQTSALLAAPFIVSILMMPLLTAITRHHGAWLVTMISLPFAAAILTLFFIPSSFLGGLSVLALFGVALAGLMVTGDLLIADLVDADELVTGARREGMYFGVNGTMIRLVFVIQGIVSAVVLTSTGYIAQGVGEPVPTQPPAAVLGIEMMTAGLPALALIMAIFLLWRYGLRGRKLMQTRLRLEERRQQQGIAQASGQVSETGI